MHTELLLPAETSHAQLNVHKRSKEESFDGTLPFSAIHSKNVRLKPAKYKFT